jgi:hypothetical protein
MARQIKERRFTDEQVDAANNADLLDYVQRAGYTIQRHGNHLFRLKEMDSCIIDPQKNTWKRYSENMWGNVVSFVMHFENKDYPKAVYKLLGIYHPELLPDDAWQRPSVRAQIDDIKKFLAQKNEPVIKSPVLDRMQKEKDDDKQGPAVFALPKNNINNNRVMAYLSNTRGIDSQVVIDCLRKKILYEDAERHNCVFVGYDNENNARYAGLRGTYTQNGNAFKGDVTGSDKAYSWAYTPPKDHPSDTLYIYESPIEVMSDMTLQKMDGMDYRAAHRLSLGCLANEPVERYLNDHPEIKKTVLCLNNDIAGRNRTEALASELSARGYSCSDWYVKDTITLCTFKNWSRVESFLNLHPDIKNINIQLKDPEDKDAARLHIQKLKERGCHCFGNNQNPDYANDLNEKLQLKKKSVRERDTEVSR